MRIEINMNKEIEKAEKGDTHNGEEVFMILTRNYNKIKQEIISKIQNHNPQTKADFSIVGNTLVTDETQHKTGDKIQKEDGDEK